MSNKPKKRILYANANYVGMVSKDGYFVDKTDYIEKLEVIEEPVFLRPRRFGKSLFWNLIFSNAKLKKMKTTIKKFTLRKKDTDQLIKYVDDLKKSYPTAKVSQYVIYCFGNNGFRVFEVWNSGDSLLN